MPSHLPKAQAMRNPRIEQINEDAVMPVDEGDGHTEMKLRHGPDEGKRHGRAAWLRLRDGCTLRQSEAEWD